MNKEALIEAYFEHRLTADDAEAMSVLLETDAAFKAAFREEYELREAIRKEERAVLKERFNALDRERPGLSIRFLAAATVLVLLGIGSLFFFNRPADLQKLYTQYYEPYPNVVSPTVRNRPSLDSHPADGAFKLYDQGHYAAAAEAFYRTYESEPSDTLFFYYTMSLMADEQTGQALDLLKSHSWHATSSYKSLSEWYTALAYLKLGKEAPAKQLLKTIARADVLLSQRAAVLLEELD